MVNVLKMMRIVSKAIPHNSMRYDTVGDYWTQKDGTIQFRVSKMADPRYQWLVLIHEIVEKFLCLVEGIKDADIDVFDFQFEKDRLHGHHSASAEPGDAPGCPYGRQHCLATAVERLLAGYLNIPWEEYDGAVMKLDYNPRKRK